MRPFKSTGKLANQLTVLFLLTTGILANWQTVSYAQWSATVPNPVLEYHYSYDNNGNITSIYNAVTVSNSVFIYDEVDRLTFAVGLYGSQNYSYDSVGNISTGINPATDANGNATDYTVNNITRHIDYDCENRPIKITDTAGTITEFAYDYSGQRVYKKVSSGAVSSEDYYVGNIYEENYAVDSSTTVPLYHSTTNYVYAGSIRVAAIVKENSDLNQTYYYHGDHLGSSSIITDGSGTVIRNISYQPWGKVHSNTEAPGASTDYNPPQKFTGQILDDSTDLYYYQARYYDPVLRRFITPDIYVQNKYDPQSLNRYSYCRNNPLKYTDPSGHFLWIPVMVAAAMGGTHGDIFDIHAWRSFDVKAAAISGLAASVGQYAYIGAGGGFLGNIAAGASGGFVSGGLSSGNINGAFQGALGGGLQGGLNFAISSQVPIFSMKGNHISVSNPITGAISSYMTAKIMGSDDPWKAARTSFWSATLTNIGTMSYNTLKGNPVPDIKPGEAHYGARGLQPVPAALRAVFSVFGIQHSYFMEQYGATTEAYADYDLAHYGSGHPASSGNPTNRGFGTWEDPSSINSSDISMTGDLGGSYNPYTNNCNSWTGKFLW